MSLRRMPYVPEPSQCARDAQVMDEARERREAAQPRHHGSGNLYCPQGHNVAWIAGTYDECAACGAAMTADAEEVYFDALISSRGSL